MKKIIGLAAVAAVLTVSARFAIYTEDCNLMIVGLTFAALFAILYLGSYIFNKLQAREK